MSIDATSTAKAEKIITEHFCLICNHLATLPELQHIEKELFGSSKKDRSRIIHQLEKKGQESEFRMEFLHMSCYSKLQTINICRTCYQSARQEGQGKEEN
jgi:hypothetical protein